jgi:hypothetical protein
MSDAEIRLECLKLAIAMGGGPDAVTTARSLVQFVTAC